MLTAVALVLALSLFAFETAVHSAHHFSYLNQATQCGVASTSAHLAGTAAASVAIETPTLLLETVPGARLTDPSIACLGPAQGRAPPSFTASTSRHF